MERRRHHGVAVDVGEDQVVHGALPAVQVHLLYYPSLSLSPSLSLYLSLSLTKRCVGAPACQAATKAIADALAGGPLTRRKVHAFAKHPSGSHSGAPGSRLPSDRLVLDPSVPKPPGPAIPQVQADAPAELGEDPRRRTRSLGTLVLAHRPGRGGSLPLSPKVLLDMVPPGQRARPRTKVMAAPDRRQEIQCPAVCKSSKD